MTQTIKIGISPYRLCQNLIQCKYPAEYHCKQCHTSFCAKHGIEHKKLVACAITPRICDDCRYVPLSQGEF